MTEPFRPEEEMYDPDEDVVTGMTAPPADDEGVEPPEFGAEEEVPPPEEQRSDTWSPPGDNKTNFALEIPELVRDRLVAYIDTNLEHHRARTQNRTETIEKWWERYQGIPPIRLRDMRQTAASNLHIPITAETVDSMHARIILPFFAVGHEIFDVLPQSEYGATVAMNVREYLAYWVARVKFHERLDTLTLNCLVEGTGVAELSYARNEFTGGAGPRLDNVSVRDFVCVPLEVEELDDAMFVGHRFEDTLGRLREYEAQGHYVNVESVASTYLSDSERQDYSGAREQMEEAPGMEAEEARPIPLWKLYYWFDMDGDNIMEMYQAIYSEQARTFLRIQGFPYDKRTPPYILMKVLPIPNYIYGRSVVGIVNGLQQGYNAFTNRTLDWLGFSMNPPIFLQRGTKLDWKDRGGYGPGDFIYVDDVNNSAREMALRGIDPSVFKILELFQVAKERVTRITDPSLGRFNAGQRTAFEVNAVLSEGMKTFDVLINRVKMTAIYRFGWLLLWMLYQFRPRLDQFYNPGGKGGAITKAMLRGEDATGKPLSEDRAMSHIEIVPTGIESEATKEMTRQQFMQYLQLTASLPMFASIVSRPDLAWNLLERLTRHMGMKDVTRYIGTAEEHQIWAVLLQAIQANPQFGQQLMTLAQQVLQQGATGAGGQSPPQQGAG